MGSSLDTGHFYLNRLGKYCPDLTLFITTFYHLNMGVPYLSLAHLASRPRPRGFPLAFKILSFADRLKRFDEEFFNCVCHFAQFFRCVYDSSLRQKGLPQDLPVGNSIVNFLRKNRFLPGQRYLTMSERFLERLGKTFSVKIKTPGHEP